MNRVWPPLQAGNARIIALVPVGRREHPEAGWNEYAAG
jgi:hypothetical protein